MSRQEKVKITATKLFYEEIVFLKKVSVPKKYWPALGKLNFFLYIHSINLAYFFLFQMEYKISKPQSNFSVIYTKFPLHTIKIWLWYLISLLHREIFDLNTVSQLARNVDRIYSSVIEHQQLNQLLSITFNK